MLDTRKLSDRTVLNWLSHILKDREFLNDDVASILVNEFGLEFDSFLTEVKKLGQAVLNETIEKLYKAYLNDSEKLKTLFHSCTLSGTPNESFVIHPLLHEIAKIESKSVGKGEVVSLFMLKDSSSMGMNQLYDVICPINGQQKNLHVKDFMKSRSGTMGNLTARAELLKTAPFLLLEKLGIEIDKKIVVDSFSKFGISQENLLKEVYKTSELRSAARKFADDLDKELQDSKMMGDVAGFIILKAKNDELFLTFLDKKDVGFYELGGRGIKMCRRNNRFFNAIMARTRAAEKAEKLINLEVMAKQKQLDTEKCEKRIYETWIECKTYAETARRLKLSQSTVKKGIKNHESRINRRIDEASLEGSLGSN